MRWPVLDAVLVTAVRGDLASAALVKDHVPFSRPARGLVADLRLLSSLPCFIDCVRSRFLGNEYGNIEDNG
jgi:hypothetical protein